MKAHVSMSHGSPALLLVMIFLCCIESMVQATTSQLEVRQLLKRLNKPAIKTIKSPDGDIIDCVHIYHQPAFDHPLLKNHTVQMRPSIPPSGLHGENEVASNMETSSIHQLWRQNGWCPENTIPIKRTKKDDVLRASSVERYGKKSHRTIPNPISSYMQEIVQGHEHALVYAQGGFYYGAKAIMNVWNPKVEQNEFSLSQLWVMGGPDKLLDSVEAGWHVYPNLHDDKKTRLFTYWTQDGYQSTGCYNLICPGFIQVSKEVALGAAIEPVSTYGGPQYEITLQVWKDPKTGNWWVQYENLSPLGYWPASLFPYLTNGSSLVEWGGEVVNYNFSGQHTTTEMGSGHFPGEGSGKASYVRNIQIVDQSNNLQAPQGIETFNTRPTCYNLSHADNYIYFGGPGKNPNCL
ncbi:protein neprosin-like [Elaeis guineensis]|uniref:protein neprosin-like n=1 Tax=Elaeis guineensis var. tenera TaxID=51953 RepID=UPI003C6D39A5